MHQEVKTTFTTTTLCQIIPAAGIIKQGFFWAPSGRLWEAPDLRWAEFLCKNFKFFRGKSSFFML